MNAATVTDEGVVLRPMPLCERCGEMIAKSPSTTCTPCADQALMVRIQELVAERGGDTIRRPDVLRAQQELGGVLEVVR